LFLLFSTIIYNYQSISTSFITIPSKFFQTSSNLSQLHLTSSQIHQNPYQTSSISHNFTKIHFNNTISINFNITPSKSFQTSQHQSIIIQIKPSSIFKRKFILLVGSHWSRKINFHPKIIACAFDGGDFLGAYKIDARTFRVRPKNLKW